nr:putative serpin-Z5 [Setaria viridis]
MINNWVKKATDNLIDSIISTRDIDADANLVLANAVYFKGAWSHPFRHIYTTPGTFHRLDGSLAEAGFMPNLVELDADEGTRYSMFIFLPDTCDGLPTMVDVVTASPPFLYGILVEMKTRRVAIELPKIEISFSLGDLDPDLSRLGLSLPLSPEAADLHGMCKGDYDDDDATGGARQPTFLTKVAHRAVVKVNEMGMEAVALLIPEVAAAHPSCTAYGCAASGLIYHWATKKQSLYLHPCCAALRMESFLHDEQYHVKLCGEVRLRCVDCGEKARTFSSKTKLWAYQWCYEGAKEY